MGYYLIEGGKPISGEFAVRGSKNAALPILAATLLAEDEVVLENCPLIRDFYLTLDILRELGCRVELTGRTAVIDTRQIQDVKIREETVQKMRSSILFLGALLGRERKAILGHPGGCAIGERPIDIHLKAFEKMGVEIIEENGLFYCDAPHILGYHIYLNYPSVGATENILLLAVKAEGVTVIHNAAREPEIVALVRFLRACGAEIYGEGTPSIMIEGVKKLHGAYFSIPFDRIEAGTFLCASAMTGGELYLTGIEKNDIETTLEALVKTGCQFNIEADRIWMKPPKELKSGFSLVTGPFPGFPTDMQPLMMSLLTLAKGTCMISETVFEARFRHADELCRMGADIVIEDRVAQIKGCGGLHGAEVFGRDLRGGAALLIAALAAEGKSTVYGSEYVERGYEKIEDALSLLGGNVRLME
ncbi:UDP-N-acetylglucosamine 1-carboxyvinyltransferase [Anaerotignum propionicum]|uniref:UDP-N-acetylglucosamine 1-carboxyvinyltransferase n=1 Tax=Anaerotignum propionicum TaxID=28446 RepID=UPI0028A1EFA0|nr:UDP-N-acetylglucosamine 1-carboxyvinyltransferase [Anaerotignum propionicum]